MSLFTSENSFQPLAARMRPTRVDHFLGQDHILAVGKPLREALDSGTLHSMILWGPPGVGKTTLAKMIAEMCDVHFEPVSAVLSGVKDIRNAIARTQQNNLSGGRKTILFVDEVHRFNKAQQDAFLPFVEDGTIIFIGATTENPSFELNNALLSRTRVYKLKSLDADALVRIVDRALKDDSSLAQRHLQISDEHKVMLANASDGDARKILNLLEIAADLTTDQQISTEVMAEVLAGDSRRFDKGGDIFYEQISALHKAVRGSSPDGSIYWFTRMIDAGCDPLYIARRVVRMASEDIGNADPRALQIALNAWEAQERLGSPEGHLAIAQAVVYLACAPKSNAVYGAYNAVLTDVDSGPSYDVPLHLRNASTKLMQEMGYGEEYHYAHDAEDGFIAGESYLPFEMQGQRYYYPVSRGLEIRIGEKLASLRELDNNSSFQRTAHQPGDDETPEENNK
jgi:putative ATPase